MRSAIFLLLYTLLGSTLSNCQTGASPPEEIDADFVWRVCNQSKSFALQKVTAYGSGEVSQDSIKIEEIAPTKCSSYYAGFREGKNPISWLEFTQNNEKYLVTYLESFQVVRGLIDSTAVSQTPGKYTYYSIYDPNGEPKWGPKYGPVWIEVERETYH